MGIITEAKMKRNGGAVDPSALAGLQQQVKDKLDSESTALYATARLWDDGIIDPRDTRTVIAISLSAAYSAPVRGTTSWGVFRH